MIGGAACDIMLEEAGSGFWATKDLDVVLILEALTSEFGKTFWDFLNEGRYGNKSRSSGEPQFYRFDKTETLGYPYMVELFSRMPFEMERENRILTPVHIDDEVSSLSAILFNDAYYQMLLDGNDSILLLEEVREDTSVFLNQYEREPADLKNLRIKDITNAEIIGRLKDVYQM